MEKETWTSSEICEKNWWTCFRLRMRGRLCEIRSCEVGNLRNIHQRGGGGREVGRSHKNNLCVPSDCAGQVRGGKGRRRLTRTANRGGTPQVSYDKRSQRNCF